jgi:hypothetical protein
VGGERAEVVLQPQVDEQVAVTGSAEQDARSGSQQDRRKDLRLRLCGQQLREQDDQQPRVIKAVTISAVM